MIPTKNAQEIASSLRYLAWVIESLEDLTFRVGVEVVEKPDGLAFGLIDTSRVASSAARRPKRPTRWFASGRLSFDARS